MKHLWQVQEAKNKFSQVLDEASKHGPQVITKRGEEVAIILSYQDYRKLTSSQKKLSTFFLESSLRGISLDLERDHSESRENLKL